MQEKTFDGLVKIDNEGMKAIKGGYSLHTVTVSSGPPTGEGYEPVEGGCPDHGNNCDGDDGIHND